MNLSIHEDSSLISGLAQGLRDLVLPWLWLWPWLWPAAAALIRPLAWELPYTAGVALRRRTTTTKNPNKQTNKKTMMLDKKLLYNLNLPVIKVGLFSVPVSPGKKNLNV